VRQLVVRKKRSGEAREACMSGLWGINMGAYEILEFSWGKNRSREKGHTCMWRSDGQ